MHQPRFAFRATSRDSQSRSPEPVDIKSGQLWCRPDEARSGAGATRGPVSHRSVYPEPTLTTFVRLEPGQPPVSGASGVAVIVLLDRLDELLPHITPAPPLLGRLVLVQCGRRPARRSVSLSENDEYCQRRFEMKRCVTETRSSARFCVPVSRVRVGNIERCPWKKAWTPEFPMPRPRSRSGPSCSRSQKWRAARGRDSGPSTSLLMSRSSSSGFSAAPAFPSIARSPNTRLERNS